MKTKRVLALVLAVVMVFSLIPFTTYAASCATGDHAIVVIPAKAPTYTEVGWAEYELCENCEYSTFAGFIPSLGGEPEIDNYEEFVYNLAFLEEIAYEYVRMNPGKDPLALVIKYIRTGVERYNSGSWGIMAGYEDADFAKFVTMLESQFNAESTDGSYLKVSGLKNLKRFTLPNGQEADIGHVFGSMDITYHNKGSINHADVSGWAGDLVDLLEYSDATGISGSLDEMIEKVTDKCLGKTPHIDGVGGMSQEDIEGDLDAVYIMDKLYSTEYTVGNLYGTFLEYYTEELSNAQRADYFLKSRLETTGTRNQIRNAVFNAYMGNKVVSTLEGTREFKSSDITELRKAVCYAFADYLCELAGDYVAKNENKFYNVFESSSSVLAPGIVYESYRATSADGKQMVYYVATADITRNDVHLFANYNNADPSKWEMARVLDQANAAQNKYGNPESPDYIKDYNVIVSTNADGYNMSTGEPGGLLIMDGKEWHGISSSGFFGITKEGKAIIGTTAEYNKTYRGQLKEAVGGFGTRLVKDGVIAVSTASNYYNNRASRTAVGITKTGKVVLMVFDGRQEPYSCGASMEEIAQVMFEAGCVDAVNLDGGGSTTMVAKLQGSDELAVTNSPSDGAPRSVSTSLLMVSTAPSSTAFDHANLESEYNYITKGTSIKINPVGISATGNVTDLPQGYTWAVSDSRWGSITEDGVFTGLRNGSVDVYLMLDGAVIGSKTITIVVPESIYFTRDSIDAVYGSEIALPISALYEGKRVALNPADVVFMLSNEKAGSFNGFKFTPAENSGLKRVTVEAAWSVENSDVMSGSIVVNIYKQGENTFDFDKATGGDRMLAFDRVVTNSTNDGTSYIAVDTNKDMVTSYSFAMDMTQIPIPQRLADLVYMLPGADMENASAWNFLLQLAERISTLSEVTPVLKFDPRFDVDYSELSVMNEYFTLVDKSFDKKTNTLTLRLRWIDQTKAIDPATANPLCLVTGVKLTPKDGAYDANNRINAVHFGSISYKVYLRASALYSFAQKPENQEVFGLLPFVNPDDPSEKGGYFGDVYKEFEDNYTLINAKKNGWYIEDGGYTYYIEGVRMAGGVKKVGNYYYYFNDKGVNDGQTKYTGIFHVDSIGKYRFAKAGVLVGGWQSIGKDWYYFDTTTYDAISGKHKIGGVNYEFEVNGKLKSGVWVNVFVGYRYYYGPDYYRTKWQEIDGNWYYFRNGVRVTGKILVTALDNTGVRRWYDFGDNGALKGLVTGIVTDENGDLYWCEEGRTKEIGLFCYNGDYYYSHISGKLITNQRYYAWLIHESSELPKGHYDFGADGKMLGVNDEGGISGIVEKDGVLYYYENGKPTEKGLFKYEGAYYYSRYNGALVVNAKYYAYKVDASCDLPAGHYEFGADGRMLNGIVEKNGVKYYYENGVGIEKGLFYLDGYHYFAKSNGELVVNQKFYAWKLDSSATLQKDHYQFDENGHVLYEGIVEIGGELFYYENGKPIEKGLFKYNGGYYYSRYNGSLIVNTKHYAYKVDKSSDLPAGHYEFGADGKMLNGIVDKNGVLYYYENGNPKEKFLFEYEGAYYYSRYNGALVVNGKYYAYKVDASCNLPVGHYEFGADGKMLNGIVDKNGVLYYYENGNPKEKFLFEYEGAYYYSRYNGALVVNAKYYAYKVDPTCKLPVGHYEFGADGKMLNGIVDKNGTLYYYENGAPVEKGLFKYEGAYYYTRYNGALVVGEKYYAYKVDADCDLPVGHYEFGADGKMLDGIVEKNGAKYYYENGAPVEKGLFVMDGYYYYARYDGKLITNQTYYVWKGNDLLFEKNYVFNELGQIIG